jgi:probable phosphomutase (TIGR03848 family)
MTALATVHDMATLILVRHGRTTANASGMLAGRLPGVKLDDTGLEQARQAGERLAAVPLAAVVSSPLERCRQTARPIVRAQAGAPRVSTDRGITECDYGDWQGRQLKELAKERLWSTVQTQPSAAVFPGGESMAAMQARAVSAVRLQDARVEAERGPGAVWVAVSHGDVIKSILADALGMHLDLFQRLHIDPASISIVRYTGARPYVLATNTHSGDLSWLAPPPAKPAARKSSRARRTSSRADDAAVGGGAGPSVTS